MCSRLCSYKGQFFSNISFILFLAIYFVGTPPGSSGYGGPSDHLKSEPITVSSDEAGGNGEDEEVPSPPHHIPRGPSPEPKIEDTECHRSQSAMLVYKS